MPDKSSAAGWEACEETTDDLLLRGGLKGRFASDFCLLQCMVDALERYLDSSCTAAVRETAIPMLHRMTNRIHRLERLADNASDLAMGTALGGARLFSVQEMNQCLEELADCANEELVLCKVPGKVQFEPDPAGEPWLVNTDVGLMDTLFANLFSNSFCTDRTADVRLTAKPGGCLEYRDGRIWPPEVCETLNAGTLSPVLAGQGSIGLLLIRSCAERLGWRLETAQEENATILRLFLPEASGQPFGSQNTLRTPRAATGVHRNRLREEFRAVLYEPTQTE